MHRENGRILIVDPDADETALLRAGLEKQFSVQTALSLADARTQVTEDTALALILLVSAGLPEKTAGFMAWLAAMPQLCGLPLVLLLEARQERTFEKAYDLGAMDVIAKPYSLPLLIRRMQSLLRHDDTLRRDIPADPLNGSVPQKKQLDLLARQLPGRLVKYRMDEFATITYVSAGLYRLLGYTRREFDAQFGGRFSELICAEDRQRVYEENAAQYSAHRAELHCVYRIECRDGRKKWFYAVGRTFREEDGTVSAFVLLIDVDETKAYEQKALEEAKKVSVLVANAPGGVLAFRQINGKITCTFISRNAAELHGETLKAVSARLAESYDWYIYPRDRAKVEKAAWAAIAAQAVFHQQFRIRRADDTVIWISMVGTPYLAADGTLTYYCSSSDITALKESERKLKEETEKTLKVLQLAQVSVWEYDLPRDRCTWNEKLSFAGTPPVRSYTGLSQAGAKVSCICADSADSYREMLTAIMHGAETVTKVIHVRLPNGTELWQHVAAHTNFRGGKPVGAVFYARDISDTVAGELRYTREIQYLDSVHSENLLDKSRIDITGDRLETYHSHYGQNLCRPGISYREVLETIAAHTVNAAQRSQIQKLFAPAHLKKIFRAGQTELRLRYLRILTQDQPPVWAELTIKLFENPDNHALNAFLYSYNIHHEVTLQRIMDRLFDSDYGTIALVDANYRNMHIIKTSHVPLRLDNAADIDYPRRLERIISRYVVPEEQQAAAEALSLEKICEKLQGKKRYRCVFSMRIDGEIHHNRWEFVSLNEKENVFIYCRTDVTMLARQNLGK